MAQEYAKNQPHGYKNHIENVAIVGGGGRVGKFIAEALLQTGKHKVTAISREDSTSQVPAGAEVKKVNYDNQESLVEALKDQDALIITMSVMAPRDQQTKLIDAAAAAGVPWVLPNEFGGDPLDAELGKDTVLGPMKDIYRNQIEALGKSSWIAIVTGFWYEFSLATGINHYGFDIPNRTVRLMDNGTTKINTTTWPQVGRGVAALLSLKILPDDEGDASPHLSSFRNKPAYLSSFTVGQADMFTSLLRVTGTTRDDWTISHTTAKDEFRAGQELFQQGDRVGFARLLYARAFFPPPDTNGEYGSTTGLHNGVLGLPVEDLDEFTRVAVDMSEKVSG